MKTETEIRRGTTRRRAPQVPAPPRPRRPARPGTTPRPAVPTTTGLRTVPKTPRTTGPKTTGRPAAPGRARVRRGRHGRAPRAPFVLLVVGLMCGGLVGLLLLNTVLAKDSFVADQLRAGNQKIREQTEEAKTQNIRDNGPGAVDERARKHGMRPDRSAPRFVTPAPVTGD